MYDVAIIGGGPAGLTAGIYCARAGKSVIIFEKEVLGGKITETPSVKNIPGFISVQGIEFAENLSKQAESCGCEIQYSFIQDLAEFHDESGNAYVRLCDEFRDSYTARTCIIATGTTNRVLGLENEEKYIGKGICFCVTCDGPFFKGKDVAVIGGGNTAVTNAIELSKIAKKVFIIQNLPELTAESMLCDQLEAINNVQIRTNVRVKKYLESNDRLRGIVLDSGEEIYIDGIFLSIGMIPNNQPFSNSCILNDSGYIMVNDAQRVLNSKLIFACGDCTDNPIKQVVVACGSGATAAINATNYLNRR